ncbi:transposase family protein [Nonomuraea jabiensis]|uniref:transposase family protein n=1 Tax=Nonomuraea jabiensis TaxID=882448 RepID=UPI00341C375C
MSTPVDQEQGPRSRAISPIDVLARHLEHVTVADPLTDLLDLPTLAQVLDTVPDPRSRRGRRYRLAPLLALSLLAVLGGATSLAKIARFIAGYDPDLRARAGLPGTVRLATSTLGRLLARLPGRRCLRHRDLHLSGLAH